MSYVQYNYIFGAVMPYRIGSGAKKGVSGGLKGKGRVREDQEGGIQQGVGQKAGAWGLTDFDQSRKGKGEWGVVRVGRQGQWGVVVGRQG